MDVAEQMVFHQYSCAERLTTGCNGPALSRRYLGGGQRRHGGVRSFGDDQQDLTGEIKKQAQGEQDQVELI